MVTTRSDSSKQSASASRMAPSPASDLSACSAMPRRRVTGVRRSCATLSSAFFMPAIKASIFANIWLNRTTSSFELVTRLIGGNPSVEAAGIDDRSRHRAEITDRPQGAKSQKCSAGHADENHGDDRRQQRFAKTFQHFFAILDALTHLQQFFVCESDRGDLQQAAVFSGSVVMPTTLSFVWRPREIELRPERWMAQQQSGVIRIDDPNEKRAAPAGNALVLNDAFEGADAPALDQRLVL